MKALAYYAVSRAVSIPLSAALKELKRQRWSWVFFGEVCLYVDSLCRWVAAPVYNCHSGNQTLLFQVLTMVPGCVFRSLQQRYIRKLVAAVSPAFVLSVNGVPIRTFLAQMRWPMPQAALLPPCQLKCVYLGPRVHFCPPRNGLRDVYDRL